MTQPIYQAFARITMEVEGGWERALDALRAGQRVRQLARAEGYSHQLLYKYAHSTDERWAEFCKARKQGAHGLVEEAAEILENANPLFPGDVSKAREQAGHIRWMAERYNKDEFGGTPQVAVQLNIGALHLDALRARNVGHIPSTPALPAIEQAEVVEAEVLALPELPQQIARRSA